MKVKLNIFFWIFLCCVIFPRAWGEETVNVNTFYPIPSGIYSNLKSETMAVGEKENTGLPSEKGVLRFQLRGEPSGGEKGDLYFDASGVKFKYYDGSAWKTLGSGTASNCGWFRDECPVGWECPGTGEEYNRQIANDDLPVVGPEYKYIWRQHNSYLNNTYVCETRNIDPDNPPSNLIFSGISKNYRYSYYFCNDCFGDGCTSYEKVYNSGGSHVKTTVIGSGICTLYLYRCVYPRGPEAVETAGTYNMLYCCPPE